MATIINISPIDFEKDVAVGIDLPMLGSHGSSFKLNYTTLDQAVANARNLLLTNRGERVMQPEFGCDLDNIVFENLTNSVIATVESNIRSNFDYWLPYIFINSLSVVPNQDSNKLYISITISLEGNQFSTRSISLEVVPN